MLNFVRSWADRPSQPYAEPEAVTTQRLNKIEAQRAALRLAGAPARQAYRDACLAFFEQTRPHWPALYHGRVTLLNQWVRYQADVRGAILRPRELQELLDLLTPLAEQAADQFLTIIPRAPTDLWVAHAVAFLSGVFAPRMLDEHLDALGTEALAPLKRVAEEWGFNSLKAVPDSLTVLHPATWMFAMQTGQDRNAYMRGVMREQKVSEGEISAKLGPEPGPDPLLERYEALRLRAREIHAIDITETSKAACERAGIGVDLPAVAWSHLPPGVAPSTPPTGQASRR
jgi:hypothetical protein